MNIILYTTHCPMCKMLKRILDDANIKYEMCDDVDLMIAKGFKKAPVLEVNGEYLNIVEARKWVEEHR